MRLLSHWIAAQKGRAPQVLELWILFVVLLLSVPQAGARSRKPLPKQRAHQVKGLSLEVTARFKKERRGDGSPTIHYRYTFRNRSLKPIFLSVYRRPVRATELKPKSAFRIRKTRRRPHRLRPPRKSDILKIKPRSKKTLKDWQWSSSFRLDNKNRSFVDIYVLKKPARITMRICFTGKSLTTLKPFLPKGAAFWTGKVCAKPVKVRLRSLPTAP